MSAISRAASTQIESYGNDNMNSGVLNKPQTETYKKIALKDKIQSVVQHIFFVVAVTFLATFISIGTAGIAIVPIVACIAFGATTLGSIAHLFGKVFPRADQDTYEEEIEKNEDKKPQELGTNNEQNNNSYTTDWMDDELENRLQNVLKD